MGLPLLVYQSKIKKSMKKVSSSVWSRTRDSYTNFMAAKDGGDKYDSEDEARRLLKEINIAIEQVQESQFYAKLRYQIESAEFQNRLKSILGSHSQLNMVLFALKSLVYHFEPHHQLAIAVLIKRDCSWIREIEVSHPHLFPADLIVLKELGCNVLTFDERCSRRVDQPMLFYLPFPTYDHFGNLLDANWCPAQMNQLIILTNRMTDSRRKDEYTKAILNHTKEMVVENYGGPTDNIIYNFAWHFFEVDPQMDMETLFEGKFSKKSRLMRKRYQTKREADDILAEEKIAEEIFMSPFVRGASEEEEEEEGGGGGHSYWAASFATYRGPRKYRCCSNAPPKDWIKLNIGGIGGHGNVPAGFGGICHDEFMKPVLSYNGFLEHDIDESAACVEALKRGVSELLSKSECRNLIVEGDNLKVIQWANKKHKAHKPPEEIGRFLEEVFYLFKKFKSVVIYHVYEEANLKASDLAKKGAAAGRKNNTLLGKLFRGQYLRKLIN